jgi:hypothetical protein
MRLESVASIWLFFGNHANCKRDAVPSNDVVKGVPTDSLLQAGFSSRLRRKSFHAEVKRQGIQPRKSLKNKDLGKEVRGECP